MKKTFYTLATCAALFYATPSWAIWVGHYRTKSPDLDLQTKLPMYDLERCVVEIDGPSVPSVYRQPDRPNEVLIAWIGGDFGGVTVIKLEGLTSARLRFWGRSKIMRRVQEDCLTPHQLPDGKVQSQ